MGEMIEVSVIVPAYNEEGNIPILMERIAQVFQGHGIVGEVILVDDGSTDGTAQEAARCAQEYTFLRVLTHRRNRGLTAALQTAVQAASGDVIVFLPADLQFSPEEIPRLLAPIHEGADIVTGWKQGDYDKRFVSSVFNSLSRFLFKVRVHDMTSIKAFRKEIVDDLPWRRDWHRYLVALAAARGYRVEEIKVQLYPRQHGESKFGRSRILIGLLDLISVKFYLSFAEKPMLFFGTSGGLVLIIGFLLGLVYSYSRLIHPLPLKPSITLVTLFILTGIQLFAVGFLGELLIETRD